MNKPNSQLEEEYYRRRAAMVLNQISARGVKDPAVLAAMRTVPRHEFVPEADREAAYDDGPLPIGRAQTISQPYIVGSMTELLQLKASDRVLEIGTGCGYQTAVLAEIARHVYSVERIGSLQIEAMRTLDRLRYRNISLRVGDGFGGWSAYAPYDAIIVTAAAPKLPERLVEQLAPGGRFVLPIEKARGQQLVRFTNSEQGLAQEDLYAVRFVPMLEDIEPE